MGSFVGLLLFIFLAIVFNYFDKILKNVPIEEDIFEPKDTLPPVVHKPEAKPIHIEKITDDKRSISFKEQPEGEGESLEWAGANLRGLTQDWDSDDFEPLQMNDEDEEKEFKMELPDLSEKENLVTAIILAEIFTRPRFRKGFMVRG